MQLVLILGIACAIGAVVFALQNNVAVTVTFLFWRFDSTLALVLLMALGLGALTAALVSTPAVLRGQWGGARQRRRNEALERENQQLQQQLRALQARLPAESEPPQRMADLRRMLVGEDGHRPEEKP